MNRTVIYFMIMLAASVAPAPSARGETGEDPIAVRNQQAQPGQPISTLRYWKIRKGEFSRFLQVSQNGVWPYFEKIGARVVGMWQVLSVVPDDKAGGLNNSGFRQLPDNGEDYDEVYLLTRYASLDHWQATRNAASLGGNGPDYEAMLEALAVRQELTIETKLTFLEGFSGPNAPYYLPGTGERFSPTAN